MRLDSLTRMAIDVTDATFQTEVVDAVWDEEADRWRITTNRGDKIAARFFVIAGGVLLAFCR